MADENIMSLIQNLFIEENSLAASNQSVDLNEIKFANFPNDVGTFNQAKLENELNSAKKLLLKKLSSQVSGSGSPAAGESPQPPNASSFYSDLTTNPLLRTLTMKENELDLNDELMFASKLFPSLNGSQLKANFNDLLNNNTTPTNQNAPSQQTCEPGQQQQSNSTPSLNDIPISPLSECSFKSNHLLTPGGPTSANRTGKSGATAAANNLYGNFALINNSNGVLLQQQQQQQQSNNSSLVSGNLLANNLMNHSNSPISSNNSLLNSNASSHLSYNASSTANSFADLILGCDDTLSQNFNNYGLGNPVTNGSAALKELGKLGAARQQVPGFGSFDAQCTSSPDSFICTEEERFESQIRSLANEIHSTIQLHMNSLHMRREGLLQQLEHIKKVYFDVLRKKKANGTESSAKQLFKDQTSAYANLIDQQMLKQNNKQFDKFILPSITFSKPDTTLYKAISTLGFLNTPAFGPFCSAAGDGLEFAVPGVNSTFTIETRNCFNDELLVGRENISIEILALFNDALAQQQADAAQPLNGKSPPGHHLTVLSPTADQSQARPAVQSPLQNKKCSPLLLDYTSKSVIPHTFFDHNNGKYTVTYNVPLLKNIPQELIIKIHINALPINGSPLRVPVQTQKRQNWKLATTFGVEGECQ